MEAFVHIMIKIISFIVLFSLVGGITWGFIFQHKREKRRKIAEEEKRKRMLEDEKLDEIDPRRKRIKESLNKR